MKPCTINIDGVDQQYGNVASLRDSADQKTIYVSPRVAGVGKARALAKAWAQANGWTITNDVRGHKAEWSV